MAAGAGGAPAARTAPPFASEWSLPPAVSQEILRRYGDILRVGRLTLNGQEVAWNTGTSNEGQLESFCSCLVPSLMEAAPELAKQEPEAIRFVPYWLCKAVSINYALIEVVLMVQRRVGVLCTIETREDYGSGLVEYHVEVRPGNLICVSLSWRKGDNIIHCDPLTAKREVKGTISCLETSFQVPPVEGFAPAYSFQLRLKRSLAQIVARSLTSTIACGGPDRRIRATETICIEEPLRSDFPLESYKELQERAAAAAAQETQPTPSSSSAEAVCSDSPGGARNWPAPLDWPSEVSDGVGGGGVEAAVGCLHVRLARALGLERPVHQWPDKTTTSATDPETKVYATLTVAGQTKQTRQVPMGQNPEWDETVVFPLRAQDLRQEVVVRLFLYNARKGLRFWGRGSVPISNTLGNMTPQPSLPGAAWHRDAGAVGRRRDPTDAECLAAARPAVVDDDLGACGVRLDGHGGLAELELQLVAQPATPLPQAPQAPPQPTPTLSAGRRLAAAAAAAAAAAIRTGKGPVATPAAPEAVGRGTECDEEECIVEVGRSAMWTRPRVLDFIHVRATSGGGGGAGAPPAQGGSLWCTRPCTL